MIGEKKLAGPTRREWGKFHPPYTNVKVEGPSFPTKGQPENQEVIFFERWKRVLMIFWVLW